MASGTVLVTGASTGIGEATALHLKELGFDSIGAVRKEEDAERLRSHGLRTVKLDVTDQASISAARAELGDAPLAGLVNNAGIAVAGPLEFLPLDQLRLQLEINLVGQVAVIQQFLPSLRAGHGRIVNVSSIGGRVALPFTGAYHASKFGLEGLSDSLRRELTPLGVDVCVIEPGSIATPMWERGREHAESTTAGLSDEVTEAYGADVGAALDAATRTGERGLEPDRVARVVERALTARRPRPRYVVGADARGMILAQAALPTRLFDRIMRRAMGLRRTYTP